MIRTERIQFRGAHGDLLAARLEMPTAKPRAFALFAHCFTCSKDYKAVVRISRELAGHGIAVCRFDFTGLGESGGDFANTNFSSNLGDLLSAADYLRQNHAAPRLLIGHSLGGAAVLATAARIPESEVVVTIAAPSDTEHLSRRLLAMAPELADQEQAMVTIAGRPFQVRKQLLEDLTSHKMHDCIASLERPLLIIHSPQDETVGIDNAERIFEAASFPKSFLSVDGSDHLLTRSEDDWRFVASSIEHWALRYLSPEDSRGSSEKSEVEEGQVAVRVGSRGFATEIRAGRHTLRADEPVALGGTNSGPNPYSFMLAALGSCEVIALRMYADRKGWPLREARVRLRHSRIHAKDCEDCESSAGRIDRIDVELELEGKLSEEQRRRLTEISERCPVRRSLKGEVSIRTTTV